MEPEGLRFWTINCRALAGVAVSIWLDQCAQTTYFVRLGVHTQDVLERLNGQLLHHSKPSMCAIQWIFTPT